MAFLVGGLIFLLAKIFLPAIVVYVILAILITIALFYAVVAIIDREEPMSILGAILFILIMIQLWAWV